MKKKKKEKEASRTCCQTLPQGKEEGKSAAVFSLSRAQLERKAGPRRPVQGRGEGDSCEKGEQGKTRPARPDSIRRCYRERGEAWPARQIARKTKAECRLVGGGEKERKGKISFHTWARGGEKEKKKPPRGPTLGKERTRLTLHFIILSGKRRGEDEKRQAGAHLRNLSRKKREETEKNETLSCGRREIVTRKRSTRASVSTYQEPSNRGGKKTNLNAFFL